jgi:hypothetical protein
VQNRLLRRDRIVLIVMDRCVECELEGDDADDGYELLYRINYCPSSLTIMVNSRKVTQSICF